MEKSANKNRENRDFVQFYRPFMDQISELASQNALAFKLFMFLTKHMDNNNALCVSMKSLQELLGYSRQTISKAVKYLKDKGWLCVLKSGTTNIYILNPQIVWTSYDSQKSYCKFQTNVIVTPGENAEYLKNVNASFKYKQIDDKFIEQVRKNRIEHENNIAIMIEQGENDVEKETCLDCDNLATGNG